MAQSQKIKLTILIVCLAVGLVAGIRYLAWNNAKVLDPAVFRQTGDPQSPIKIVEYIDLQCPACANGSQQLQTIIEQNPNKIFLEVRFFPLGVHVHSMAATKFTLCAGKQGKFWPYLHLILKRQQVWSELNDPQPALLEAIKDIQLNPDTVLACTNEDELRVKILEEKDAGTTLGIKSTPTYFINGKMVVGVSPMLDEVYQLLGIPKPEQPFPFTK